MKYTYKNLWRSCRMNKLALGAIAVLCVSGLVYAGGVTHFEYYNDTAALFDNGRAFNYDLQWGSYGNVTLTLDTNQVHKGVKSLKMVYDNSADPWQCKAELNLWDPGTNGQNWGYFEKLRFWFKVTDASGYLKIALVDDWGTNMATIDYNGVEQTPVGEWVEWIIDFNDLVFQPGGTLNNIDRIDFWMDEHWDDISGTGTGFGFGTIYIDDIALLSREQSPVKVVEWKLDGDLVDSSGTGNDGLIWGTVNFADGYRGQCAEFAGVDDSAVYNWAAVNLPGGGGNNWTMNVWVYTDIDMATDDDTYHILGIASFGDVTTWPSIGGAYGRAIANYGYMQGIGFHTVGAYDKVTYVPYDVSRWQMITVTYNHNDYYMNINSGTKDTTGEALKIYKNGGLLASYNPQGQFYDGGFYPISDPKIDLPPISHDHPDTKYFEGKLDEFTIWAGALTPQQIRQLMLLGDLDLDGDVDSNDLGLFTDSWPEDYNSPADANLVLGDMEDYLAAPASPNVLDNWTVDEDSNVALVMAPGGYDGGQAVRWDYETTPAQSSYASIYYAFGNSINISSFDQLRIQFNRHAGNSDEDLLYLKLVDADGLLAAQTWISHTSGSTYSPADAWAEWVIDLHQLGFESWGGIDPKYRTLQDLKAIAAVEIGCGHEPAAPGGGTGTIDIDDIILVDFAGCSIEPEGDLDGDCDVDFRDYGLMADNWLVGT
jgi:hypothetical protein